MTPKFKTTGASIERINGFSSSMTEIEKVIPALERYDEKAWNWEENSTKNNDNDGKTITSLLIDTDVETLNKLENELHSHCPYIEIKAKLNCLDRAKLWIQSKSPDLVFFGIDTEQRNHLNVLKHNNFNFETIFLTKNDYLDTTALQYNISGCLTKPIQKVQLINATKRAQQKILLQKEYQKNKGLLANITIIKSQKDVIGIPTFEGYEFLPIEKIICCEGMQKCTKLMIAAHSDIISSYNIGEFKKLLLPFGFFSPHKSFLINLSKITKYNKEGSLTMNSGYQIPLARRRKDSFLNIIKKDLKFPIIPQR